MVWNFKPQMRAFRFAGHKVSLLAAAADGPWHLSRGLTKL